MKRVYILSALAVGCLVVGCMEDKGSYDYSPVNEITIEGIEEKYYVNSLEKFDPPIVPEFEFGLEEVSDLSYEWRIDYETVSDAPTLDIAVNLPVGVYAASLIVTDNKSTRRFFKDFTVEVTTPFTYGITVLSEREDGSSMLSFQPRNSSQTGEFLLNVFEGVNPGWGGLGKGPLLVQFRESNSKNAYYVLSREGDLRFAEIDPNTMELTSGVNETTIDDYNGPFVPEMMTTTKDGVVVLADEQLFVYDLYGSELMIPTPKTEGFTLGWVGVSNRAFLMWHYIPLYDKNRGLFLSSTKMDEKFRYNVVLPYNLEAEDMDPVFITTTGEEEGEVLTLVADGLMIDDGTPGLFGGKTEGINNSSTLRFIFRDENWNAYFVTYDYEIRQGSITEPKWGDYMARGNYGVTIDRVAVPGILTPRTVASVAAKDGYWFLANDRQISRQYWENQGSVLSATLPAEVKGNITSLQPNTDNSLLIVGVYDPSAAGDYKGGIAILNILPTSTSYEMYELVEYYPNVSGRPVSIYWREQ